MKYADTPWPTSRITEIEHDKTFWATPAVPSADVLALIGEITLRHVHLDHALKMTIKTLLGLAVDDALSQLARKGGPDLRKRIEEAARNKFGEDSPAFTRMAELLARCKIAAERRNFVVKNLYAEHVNGPRVGEVNMQADDLTWYSMPDVDELTGLAREIGSLVNEIHFERLNGWIAQAICSE